MEINELAKSLPWRKVFIKSGDRSVDKRLPHRSPFSALAASSDDAKSWLKKSLSRPCSGSKDEAPILSTADSTLSANGTVSASNPVIPRLFLGLAVALSLAIVIPWLFAGKRIETRTGAAYDAVGRAAFSRPARAGATIVEESTPISGRVEDEPETAFVPGLSRLRPLNAAVGPQRDPACESDRTPSVSGGNQSRPLQLPPDAGTRANTLEALSQQLQKIETQQRECEVVLRLLDSEPGTFAGFVPEDNLTGVSYLARFQEKIVQLEINKRSLAVRYTPRSREILAIDLEIQGIKAAMRECLEANLRFLKKDREVLLSHKAQLEGKKGPIGAGNKASRPQLSDRSDAERSWFSVSGGIGAIGRGLKNALAYISPAPDVEPAPPSKSNGGWSHLAASGPGKRPEPERRAVQENRTAGSFQAVTTANRNPDRATQQTVSGEAGQPRTNPATTRRSHVLETPLATRYGR